MTTGALLGYIHPILMGLALFPAAYAVWSGFLRALCLHFRKRVAFPWKRHVRIGAAAAALWLLGAPSGLAGAHITFGATFISGPHATVGCIMWFMALFALGSGLLLPRVKKHRYALTVAHGVNNIALFVLALSQISNGLDLVQLL